jgi:hypothetical protein
MTTASHENSSTLHDRRHHVSGQGERLYRWLLPRVQQFAGQAHGSLKGATHAQLRPHAAHMYIGGVPTDHQLPRNLTLRLALSQQTRHLDAYCFDSNPEFQLFRYLLADPQVSKVYFTGMLTHGQSDFYIQYIDPESHTVRSYYPDFYLVYNDNRRLILEVKRDDLIDDPIVRAKRTYTEQLAAASGLHYAILKGTDA